MLRDRANSSFVVYCLLSRLSALGGYASVRVILIVLSVLMHSACSDSSQTTSNASSVINGNATDDVPTDMVSGLDDPAMQSATLQWPAWLNGLSEQTPLITEIPQTVAHQMMADSGMQIAYTRHNQAIIAPASYIEAQWQFMQNCLAQVATAPIVIITGGRLMPLTADDIVLFHYGVPFASATPGNNSIMQINAADFDGSLQDMGFYLRSLLGRYLWLSANLPAGDYPYGCASS